MADNQSIEGEPPPQRRNRAPTITIDTTAVSPSQPPGDSTAPLDGQRPGYHPILLPDETASPSAVAADPLSQSWASSHRAASSTSSAGRPELRMAASFDSKDSRPTSPHNVSNPRGNDRVATFLSVPSALRSRQNSVDSEDASRSIVSSQGETVVASASVQAEGKRTSGEFSNEQIMKDRDALRADKGKEADFKVDDNPFAFSPGQLSKLFDPKSLSAFYALGGLKGIEAGLQSDRKSGLRVGETDVEKVVTFEEATKASRKELTEGVEGDFKEPTTARSNRDSYQSRTPSSDAFIDRKRVFGDNRLPEKKGMTLLQLMWITYQDKVLILLSVAAVISLGVGLYQTFGGEHAPGEPRVEWVEGVAIIGAIAIVVVVGSINDYQKERQFAELNKKKQDRNVTVVRSGVTQELSVYDLLVGDVVHLEPGDLVPADGILIQGFNVRCDESQATGEADVIRKRAADDVYAAIEGHDDIQKMDPFIQSGSRVMEGIGQFMVTATGVNSSYGQTMISLDEDPEITPLQSKLNVIAEYIAKLGGAGGLLLFLVLFIMFLVRLRSLPDTVTAAEKGQMFLNIFIVVVTIIVVAVPEGLPLAVTLALAFATKRMLKDHNLVRHLKACEVMGNATTICSDKTGTLTQNKMQIVAGTVGTSLRFGGDRPSESTGKDEEKGPSGADISASEFVGMLSKPVKELLRNSIALNSTAFEGDVDGVNTFIGSKTESAMLLFARDHLGMGPVGEERTNAQTIQIIPFDSARKCMGIVVQLENGRARLYVKGASEIVLAKCNQILRDPTRDAAVTPLTDDNHAAITTLIDTYASRSLRTLGIVYREFERWPPRSARRADGGRNEVSFDDIFRHMVFVSIVGIQDPLRKGVPEAVRQCQRAGIVVRMVTGDNKITARAIAKECGILQPNSVVMEGPQFRNLTRFEQEQIIPRLHVLARSSPEDKRILVKRLKDKGDIVAVTGDGTNDAPALKMADIGFSMGISGTEVAKEASAIILMDDNFTSIVKALKWGRAVNDAVKKFLQFQLTVNITAVVLTFVSAISSSSESSVLTAVQLLWVNLIMDTLAALALATDPPQDSVLDRKPEPRGASIISTTMWKMIIGQAIYQLTITFILYFCNPDLLPLPAAEPNPTDAQVATLVFNTFVWMQIFNQWNNRRLDDNFNIFEGITKNWFFLTINIVVAGLQVLIIFVTGPVFNIPPQGQSPTLWAIAIVLGAISIPIGMVIRLVPDRLIERLIPDSLKKKAQGRVPGLTVSDDERLDFYPSPLADVRDELAFLKRIKGGRLNNLKFAMRHPRETFLPGRSSRSPSHSRTNSLRVPGTPTREDSFGSAFTAATPESRKRSRSMRSRSNSALGAPTVMAGIVAAGVAAGWSPLVRQASSQAEDEHHRPGEQQQHRREESAADRTAEHHGGHVTISERAAEKSPMTEHQKA